MLTYLNASLKTRDGNSVSSSSVGKNGLWDWDLWKRLENSIPEKKLLLWDALYEALKKYYDCLNGRSK